MARQYSILDARNNGDNVQICKPTTPIPKPNPPQQAMLDQCSYLCNVFTVLHKAALFKNRAALCKNSFQDFIHASKNTLTALFNLRNVQIWS